jgi:hypothetical protein
MKLSFSAILLLIVASASAQQSSSGEVQSYSLEANNFIDALLKISAQFQFPLGVEWVKTADTLKPVRFSRSHTTVKDIIQTVVSMHAGYDWRTENGVIHVFQRDLVNDDRNPLNIVIKSFDEFDEQAETVEWANNNLDQMVSHVVRHTELHGISGSVLGYPGEPVFHFAAQNAPVRNILNQIVTSGTRTLLPTPKMNRIWIATFPKTPAFSPTNFLEVVPMLNQNVVSAQDQPFWMLRSWGDPPLENMVR